MGGFEPELSTSLMSSSSWLPFYLRPTVLWSSSATTYLDTRTGDPSDVTDKEENSFCDIELFVSSFEDCLLFTLNESVRIHRDAIVSKVGEEHFEKGCDFVKLTEVSYETFLRYQNDMEDLLPDKGGGEKKASKSSGPLVHFSQTSRKRMSYR